VANGPDLRRRLSQVCGKRDCRNLLRSVGRAPPCRFVRSIVFRSACDGVECAEADKSSHVPPSGGTSAACGGVCRILNALPAWGKDVQMPNRLYGPAITSGGRCDRLRHGISQETFWPSSKRRNPLTVPDCASLRMKRIALTPAHLTGSTVSLPRTPACGFATANMRTMRAKCVSARQGMSRAVRRR
jgi:hypothetical protein